MAINYIGLFRRISFYMYYSNTYKMYVKTPFKSNIVRKFRERVNTYKWKNLSLVTGVLIHQEIKYSWIEHCMHSTLPIQKGYNAKVVAQSTCDVYYLHQYRPLSRTIWEFGSTSPVWGMCIGPVLPGLHFRSASPGSP